MFCHIGKELIATVATASESATNYLRTKRTSSVAKRASPTVSFLKAYFELLSSEQAALG